jgi:hypothetical protein
MELRMTVEDKASETNIVAAKNAEDKEVVELKKDIKHREQLKEAIKENEILKIAAEKEKKELLDKAASSDQAAKAMRDKYALAELKAQAVAAGLADIDCIKMMDTTSLEVGEDGNVKGVSEIITAFKTAKPHLFGDEKKSSSSTNAGTPAGVVVKKPNAFSIPAEDRDVALKNAMSNPSQFNY